MSEPGDEQRRLDRISQYRERRLLTLQAELRDADALQAHIGALLYRYYTSSRSRTRRGYSNYLTHTFDRYTQALQRKYSLAADVAALVQSE